MKILNKLFFITVTCGFIFSSCVKTEDPLDIGGGGSGGGNPSEKIVLNSTYLQGDWEIFYNNKLIKTDASATTSSDPYGTNYRYPETEGYQISFTKDGEYSGSFIEYNTFGKQINSGTYQISLKSTSQDNDSISFSFKDKNADTIKIQKYAYPGTFENYFTRYNQYRTYMKDNSGAVGTVQYYVADTYYYRKKGSGFTLASQNKNLINPSSMMGNWEFTNYVQNSYNVTSSPSDKVEEYGTTYNFRSDNTYSVYNKLGAERERGDYRIVDDVIQMQRPYEADPAIKDSVISSLFWLKDPLVNNSFVGYNRYRDPNEYKNVITFWQTFSKR